MVHETTEYKIVRHSPYQNEINHKDVMEFVSSIHELNDHRFENLVTKEFLSEKMNEINTRFYSMENNISDTKFELIKWMFIFWLSQMTITIGIILLFIKN